MVGFKMVQKQLCTTEIHLLFRRKQVAWVHLISLSVFSLKLRRCQSIWNNPVLIRIEDFLLLSVCHIKDQKILTGSKRWR